MAFVLIPKSWCFFFFLQIIITKSPRVIARLQKKKKGKTPVSLMFFVCHSKLKWKQDSVWCQQKRMSNADAEVFFLILCLNCCFSAAPSSRGNVWKNLLLLCFQPMVATRNGVVNITGFTIQDTRFSSTVSCPPKKVLSVGLMQNRCRINSWRMTSVFFFFFCSHCIHKYYRVDAT